MRSASRASAGATAALAVALAPLAAGAAPNVRVECAAPPGATGDERRACLAMLEEAGVEIEPPALEAVARLLAEVDDASDPRLVVAGLDALRAAGPAGSPAAEAVSRLLSYRHPLYRDRDRLLVVRLRAYAFATLAELGPPPSAMPALIDVLVHADEQSPVLELAAAARAAGALGARGRFFVPYLIEAIPLRRSNEEISLERFAPEFPAAEATTVQLEAVRALAAVASPEDRAAVAILETLAGYRAGVYEDRLLAAAGDAVARIRSRAAATGSRDASAERSSP